MKMVLLIDGGHLRACYKSVNKAYDNDVIEEFAKGCVEPGESMLRVLYYDSPQFRGKVQLPVSGKQTTFSANDGWLNELAARSRFAVRRGTIGFRGWRPNMVPIKGGSTLTDSDFKPIFEQKGVDMRVGLDIASMSEQRSVDRIVLVSADTDMVPAMKHARKAGIEVVIAQLPPPAQILHGSLKAHADLVRAVALP